MDLIIKYCKNCQFHGLRYIAAKNIHWLDRIFWFICVVGSWSLGLMLMDSAYGSFSKDPFSFVTETDYVDWNISLPSVTVCETKNKDGVYPVSLELYGPKHNFNLDEVLIDVAYFKGDQYFVKTFCPPGPSQLQCPKGDLLKLSTKIRKNCTRMFQKCTWRNEPFPCCDYFLPVVTERGPCFAINSIQTDIQRPFPFISNKATGLGHLHLEIKVPSEAYIMAPEDVANINQHTDELVTIQMNLHSRRSYRIVETVNDFEVREVSIEKRRCRFPEENPSPHYKYYSYSVCLIDCRIAAQMQVCNCVNHLFPVDKSMHCNLTGLLCLIEHFQYYSVLMDSWSTKPNLICDCLPSCLEPEFTLIETDSFGMNRQRYGAVDISVFTQPSLLLKRKVVRNRLDLAVSMGGSAGLFAGASLLSFVELFYYFTVRVWLKNSTKANKKEDKLSIIRPKLDTSVNAISPLKPILN